MPIHHDMLGRKPKTTERILFPVADPSLGTSSSLVYENVLNPGAEVPLHQHPVEEVIVCTEGTAECSIGGGAWEKYGAGSVLVIPAGTPHTLRNAGPGLLRQLAFMPSGTNQTKWLAEKGSVE